MLLLNRVKGNDSIKTRLDKSNNFLQIKAEYISSMTAWKNKTLKSRRFFFFVNKPYRLIRSVLGGTHLVL